MIVTTVNYDDFYFDQLKVMLTSLSANSPLDRIKVVTVDFPDAEVSGLSKKFNKYVFENRNIGVTGTNGAADFMVSYRSVVVLEAFDEFQEKIAWFDNDLIIRKPLEPFWSDIRSNSLKVLRRDTDDVNAVFQCGVFAVGYSDAIRRYLVDYNEIVQEGKKWIGEQRELYLQYEKHKDDIHLIEMSPKYNDVGKREGGCFSDDSYIWHCKGNHFDNPIFQEEFKRYLSDYEIG